MGIQVCELVVVSLMAVSQDLSIFIQILVPLQIPLSFSVIIDYLEDDLIISQKFQE